MNFLAVLNFDVFENNILLDLKYEHFTPLFWAFPLFLCLNICLAPGAILNMFSCEFGGFSIIIYKIQKSVCPLNSHRNEPFMDPFYQISWLYFFLNIPGGSCGKDLWRNRLQTRLTICGKLFQSWNFLSIFFFQIWPSFDTFTPPKTTLDTLSMASYGVICYENIILFPPMGQYGGFRRGLGY